MFTDIGGGACFSCWEWDGVACFTCWEWELEGYKVPDDVSSVEWFERTKVLSWKVVTFSCWLWTSDDCLSKLLLRFWATRVLVPALEIMRLALTCGWTGGDGVVVAIPFCRITSISTTGISLMSYVVSVFYVVSFASLGVKRHNLALWPRFPHLSHIEGIYVYSTLTRNMLPCLSSSAIILGKSLYSSISTKTFASPIVVGLGRGLWVRIGSPGPMLYDWSLNESSNSSVCSSTFPKPEG